MTQPATTCPTVACRAARCDHRSCACKPCDCAACAERTHHAKTRRLPAWHDVPEQSPWPDEEYLTDLDATMEATP